MSIGGLLLQIPITEEILIRIIGFSGFGMAIFAIVALFRAIFLNNSLSIRRARQMIAENKAFADMAKPSGMPELELNKVPEITTPKKQKQPLLTETLPAEAEELLARITLPVNRNNGWQCNS